jgi:hypothetical protein
MQHNRVGNFLKKDYPTRLVLPEIGIIGYNNERTDNAGLKEKLFYFTL